MAAVPLSFITLTTVFAPGRTFPDSVIRRGFQPVAPALWGAENGTLSVQRDIYLSAFYHWAGQLVKEKPLNFTKNSLEIY